MTLTPPSVALPTLRQHPSPNHSTRRGVVPYLIVAHRPVGSFESAERTLTDPTPPGGDDARVSAHVLTGTGSRAVQLVPWDQKAWSCATFNAPSYNVEVADAAWLGNTVAFNEAARLFAFLCKRTGIPPHWTRDPLYAPGLIRHYDLGAAGGGHTDPTTDQRLWRRFVDRVLAEFTHGEFRPTYGVGALHRIDL